MADQPHKILIVEPDGDVLEILVSALARRFNAHVTCVATAEACLDVELLEPHDLVIAELNLDDEDGIVLAGHLTSLSSRPIILLADDPTREDTLAALRMKVRDLLVKPFPMAELLDTVERALRGHEVRRQHQAKYHRMRELLRRVIRERRDLNQRIELVCRDLVGAHRRLVHRVLDSEGAKTHQSR